MIIPTLTSNSFLYQVNKHRQHMLTQLERQKAFRYMVAIFACIAIVVTAWIIRL